jgi:hypothetical protein
LVVVYFLLNNAYAGQPNSFCLQYLQVNVPRIKPLPIVVNIISNNNAVNRIKSNFKIIRIIPITKGINDTKISGIISFQVMFALQKFEVSPCLKNNELSLPLPNPHVLRQ